MASVPLRTIAGLHESLIDYANRVHDLRSPGDVLNELHDITKKGVIVRTRSSAVPTEGRRLGFPSTWEFRFPAQGSPEGVVGRISNTGARQVPPPPVPGAVQHGSLHMG